MLEAPDASAGHPCPLHLILKTFLAFSKSSSLIGGFLWLPGCRNFFTGGRLLILVFRACNTQGHSLRRSQGQPHPWHKPETLLDKDQLSALHQHQCEAGKYTASETGRWEEEKTARSHFPQRCLSFRLYSVSIQFLLPYTKSCSFIAFVQYREEDCVCQNPHTSSLQADNENVGKLPWTRDRKYRKLNHETGQNQASH